jgi:hypothetical protein
MGGCRQSSAGHALVSGVPGRGQNMVLDTGLTAGKLQPSTQVLDRVQRQAAAHILLHGGLRCRHYMPTSNTLPISWQGLPGTADRPWMQGGGILKGGQAGPPGSADVLLSNQIQHILLSGLGHTRPPAA